MSTTVLGMFSSWHPEEEVTLLVGHGQATGEYELPPIFGLPLGHIL
jgi:hypothetical protein